MGGTFLRLGRDLYTREDLLFVITITQLSFFEFSTTPATLFLYVQFDYVSEIIENLCVPR